MSVSVTIHKPCKYLKRFFCVDEHLGSALLFASERRRWHHVAGTTSLEPRAIPAERRPVSRRANGDVWDTAVATLEVRLSLRTQNPTAICCPFKRFFPCRSIYPPNTRSKRGKTRGTTADVATTRG